MQGNDDMEITKNGEVAADGDKATAAQPASHLHSASSSRFTPTMSGTKTEETKDKGPKKLKRYRTMELHRAVVSDVLYLTDSYKVSHYNQYPPGTTHMYSYFESRGGTFDEVCFFGLQYILKRWLCGGVASPLEKIEEASEFYHDHFGANIFNEEGWKYIYEKHGGYLPLRIKAVPEGTVVPTHNVLFTVENTDPKVPWLVGWFETVLVQCWYPMTVCTLSRAHKQVIAQFMHETADSLEGLEFKLHDFGFRGCSTVESAAIGDASHLVNFVGTDTIAGLRLCRKYYGCNMAGFSIPAAEHSTVTSWGSKKESEAFRNVLEKYPDGLVSVVSDSYDVFEAVEKIWGQELKDLVLKREGKGCLVIRPDSGDPKTVVVKIFELLGKAFGYHTNSKGYKELPSYLRVIQGDGVNYTSCKEILQSMKDAGWSTVNIAFGAGGALMQKINRDTQKCAFKCSSITVNGEERDVFKDPVTDHAKKSKKGRLTLEKDSNGRYVTREQGTGDPNKDCLMTIFENGKLVKEWTLDEIRERAQIDLVKQSRAKNGADAAGTNCPPECCPSL